MNQSLKRLVIDSATKYLYIGLFSGLQDIGTFYEEGHNDHSVKLMTVIEQLFQKNNLKISDLDEIIVGIGPGSYTGLRIGVVVAKMFGWNNNIPVKTVSSLALIASSVEEKTLIVSEIDARRGNSFLGLYENDGKSLKLVEKEQLTNLKEYQSLLQNDFVTVSFGKPNMVKILHSNLLKEVKDIHQLNPNYLRMTEAERNVNNS
jgi:tRNA threonylcarbamoyladenosine biosynthesis protein TsaB